MTSEETDHFESCGSTDDDDDDDDSAAIATTTATATAAALAPIDAAIAAGATAASFGVPDSCPDLRECGVKVRELRALLVASGSCAPSAVPQRMVETASMSDDYMLLRFLIARDFDLAKACVMFDERKAFAEGCALDALHAAWERANDAVAAANGAAAAPPILSARLRLQRKIFYAGQNSADARDGTPIFVERMGRADFSGVAAEGEPMIALITEAYAIYDELIMRAVQRCSFAQHRLVRATLIVDNSGMGMGTMWNAHIIKRVANVGLSFFPESTRKIYIIRAPWFISKLWALMKPILPARTSDKVDILGESYGETISELVPPTNLPIFIGGEAKGEWVGRAEPVDDECRDLMRAALEEDAVETTSVKAPAGGGEAAST